MNIYTGELYSSNMNTWVESERPKWAESPSSAVEFARSYIGGRFHDAEDVILNSPHWTYIYARDVVGARWSSGEAVLLSEENVDTLWEYYIDVVKEPWSEARDIFRCSPYYSEKYTEYLDYLDKLGTPEQFIFSYK